MRKLLLACGVLATVFFAPRPAALDVARAMLAAPPPRASDVPLTLASGGCGPYRHRGFFGYCRLNLVRPYGPYGFYRPFRFYRPFMFIRRPFFRFRP